MHQSALKFRIGAAILTAAAAALLASCEGGRAASISYDIRTGGSPDRGRQVIVDKSCGSCHTIPGIHGANGVVGPPLMFFSRRTFIAGEIPNTPQNLRRWVMSPHSVEPNTAMPDLGLTDQQARDVAAYLYTLR